MDCWRILAGRGAVVRVAVPIAGITGIAGVSWTASSRTHAAESPTNDDGLKLRNVNYLTLRRSRLLATRFARNRFMSFARGPASVMAALREIDDAHCLRHRARSPIRNTWPGRHPGSGVAASHRFSTTIAAIRQPIPRPPDHYPDHYRVALFHATDGLRQESLSLAAATGGKG